MAEMVAVGCKLPHGLHLDIEEAGKPKRRVTVKGNNSTLVIGGFGITEGVPKDHFDHWMRTHKDHPSVVKGLIFAHVQKNSVEAIAKEKAELRSGLEQIDQKDHLVGSVKTLEKGD